MPNRPDYIQWLARVQEASPQEKSRELFLAIDLLQYDKIEPLIRAGATLDMPGQDTFCFALLRSQDFQLTHLLLDLGFSARNVRHQDFEFMHFEDPAAYFDLLARLVQAGLPFQERAKAAAHAASRDRADVVLSLVCEGEDLKTFLAEAKAYDVYKKLDSVDGNDALAAALYEVHFSGGITEQRLKEAVTAAGMTGYMLAVRAEKFAAVADFYKTHPDLRLDPEDLLKKDAHGLSVVRLLVARDMLPDLFTRELWARDCAGAQKLIEALPEKFRSKIDSESVLRDIRQAALRDISRKSLNNDKKI